MTEPAKPPDAQPAPPSPPQPARPATPQPAAPSGKPAKVAKPGKTAKARKAGAGDPAPPLPPLSGHQALAALAAEPPLPHVTGTGEGATNIPADHPRAASLRVRERMKDAVAAGLVHPTGLLAHGRGEAFDYLLGETTPPEALEAIQEAARVIRAAKRPVLSLNGNTVALAAGACDAMARAWPAIRMEVNLFHRSEERIAALIRHMEQAGAIQGTILGLQPDFRIPGLSSDRAKCTKAGIGLADVVIVPLEDGDRCEALKRMGKLVITIDLNPMSRTAQTADITIVDELTRALPLLDRHIRNPVAAAGKYDNADVLKRVRARMAAHLSHGF